MQTRKSLVILTVAALGYFSSPIANAQSMETEPNNSCDTAQKVGSVTLPFLLPGTLDESVDSDVDFYRFSADSGHELFVEQKGESTGAGSLGDPFLGWFDSNCVLQATSDDYRSLDSRLLVTVPTDGVFVVAASSFFDGDFNGSGSSRGSYELSIDVAPPRIGSISAQAMDALAGVPLVGDAPPYANFELAECMDDDCSYIVNGGAADSDGRVSFVSDSNGDPLRVGTYQVMAYASDFEMSSSDPFFVDQDEHFDLGQLFLNPPPISVSDIAPCETLPSSGGTCRYRVQINNNTSEPVRGLVWSLVDGYGLGTKLDYTTFEATASHGRSNRLAVRRSFRARALDGNVVEFKFTVPESTSDGAEFCTRLFVGLHPHPLFNPVTDNFLFCVAKNSDGFELMSIKESEKLNEVRLNGQRKSARR